MAVSGKRKRGAEFSAHDKLAHQSSVLLQREAKKVRAFLVRKVVQQLKQQRAQLAEDPTPAGANQDDKRRKRQHKLQASIARLEREHAALKTLDLQAVVARARLQTGLDQPASTSSASLEHEHQAYDSDDGSITHELADSESDDESDGESDVEPSTEAAPVAVATTTPVAKQQEPSDEELLTTLMDRVLAHKQMTPLLDAVRTRVAQEERLAEKRRRAAEKRALNRGQKGELVGGRSSSAPTSLFLGSLSGRGGLDEEDMPLGDAEDDIAEFLGEKKKHKNRPGQMARRQKAMRQEEAQRRKEERAKGIFRPHTKAPDAKSGMGKYGPSERPKKAKPKASKTRESKPKGDKTPQRKPPVAQAAVAKAKAPVADASAHPSWLAKQKQKEKEQLGLNAFSGKKITFD